MLKFKLKQFVRIRYVVIDDQVLSVFRVLFSGITVLFCKGFPVMLCVFVSSPK